MNKVVWEKFLSEHCVYVESAWTNSGFTGWKMPRIGNRVKLYQYKAGNGLFSITTDERITNIDELKAFRKKNGNISKTEGEDPSTAGFEQECSDGGLDESNTCVLRGMHDVLDGSEECDPIDGGTQVGECTAEERTRVASVAQ